jgi:Holliday junction resolvase
MTSEKSIVDAIRKYLKSIGAKTYKMHGGPHGHAGAPDIIGAHAGRPLALEVKQPGENPTPIQRHELAAWEKAGAIAGCVRSVEDTKNLLKGETA